MIPLRIHNVIDYLAGALLMIAPWLFAFSEIEVARTLFLIGGIALIAYSLLTHSYFSVFRAIPVGLHMTLDTILGLLFMLSPALFHYRGLLTDAQYVVHVVVGITLVGLVALTRPRTDASKTATERAAIGHDLPQSHS